MPRKDHGPVTLDDLQGRNFAGVGQVSAILGCDPRTIISAIHAGDIPATRVGTTYRIPVAWLREAAGQVAAASPVMS